MGEKSCYAYSMEHDTGPAPSNTSTPHPSPQDDLRALAVRLHNGLVFRALCSLVSQLVAGLVYIGARVWPWPVYSVIALLVYAGGVGAMFGAQYILASILYFVAFSLLLAKAITEALPHEKRAG